MVARPAKASEGKLEAQINKERWTAGTAPARAVKGEGRGAGYRLAEDRPALARAHASCSLALVWLA
jgi:hypothetical protein